MIGIPGAIMATVQVPSLRQYPALHTDLADLVILMMKNDQHKLTLSSTIKKVIIFQHHLPCTPPGRQSISAGSTQKKHHEQSPSRTIIIKKGVNIFQDDTFRARTRLWSGYQFPPN